VSYCVNDFRVHSCHDQAPVVLVVVVALVMVLVFIYLFQMFPKFCVQISGMDLGVRFRFRA